MCYLPSLHLKTVVLYLLHLHNKQREASRKHREKAAFQFLRESHVAFKTNKKKNEGVFANRDMKDNPLLKAKNSFAANVSYAIVIHHKFYIEPKPKHTEKNALKRWSANIT